MNPTKPIFEIFQGPVDLAVFAARRGAARRIAPPKVQEHQTSWTSSTAQCFLPSPARRGCELSVVGIRQLIKIFRCGLWEVKASLFHIVVFYSCSCTSIYFHPRIARKEHLHTKVVHLGNYAMVSCRIFHWINPLHDCSLSRHLFLDLLCRVSAGRQHGGT